MLRLGGLVGRMASLTLANSPKFAVHPGPPQIQTVRKLNFLSKLDAEDLWRGVTSVSNPGRKRGRASGGNRKRARDLNRGQVITCADQYYSQFNISYYYNHFNCICNLAFRRRCAEHALAWIECVAVEVYE